MMRTMKEHAEYQERARIQCLEWAQGQSKHNTVDDECCPDFSCCDPGNGFNVEERWQTYHRLYGRKQ